MEIGWALLLALALLDKRTRPLAFLLNLKWALNYAAFFWLAEWAPAVIDVIVGAAVVALAARIREPWAAVVWSIAVLTPLLHAAFWLLYGLGLAHGLLPVAYYLTAAALFTVQLCALSGPGGMQLVRRMVRDPRFPVACGTSDRSPRDRRGPE